MLLLPSLVGEKNKSYSVGRDVSGRVGLSGVWLLAVMLILGLSGCSASLDKHKYESTIYRPTTVGLLDTVTEELVWKMDVPVEHVLELDLNRKGEQELWQVDVDMPATDMSWLLRDRWTKKRVASGEFELPAPHGVMITVNYRPAPEEPLVSPEAVLPQTGDSVKKAMRDEVLPVDSADAIGVEAMPADTPSVDGDMQAESPLESSQVQDDVDLAVEPMMVEPMIDESPAVEPTDGVVPSVDDSSDPAPADPTTESDPLLDALDMGSGK